MAAVFACVHGPGLVMHWCQHLLMPSSMALLMIGMLLHVHGADMP